MTDRSGLKLFTDGHVAKAIIIQLRQRHVDIVRCEEVGLKHADDLTLLEYAVSQQRSMLTFDADFEKLHSAWMRKGKSHCGIFRCRHTLQGNVGQIVRFLDEYNQLIRGGAGTLEDDVYNQIIHIS